MACCHYRFSSSFPPFLIVNELRNWIISPVVPWMTTEDTLQPQKTSARDTVALYGRVRIGTASRMKTAEPFPEQHPYESMLEREGFLIQPYEQKDKSFQHTESIVPMAFICQFRSQNGERPMFIEQWPSVVISSLCENHFAKSWLASCSHSSLC